MLSMREALQQKPREREVREGRRELLSPRNRHHKRMALACCHGEPQRSVGDWESAHIPQVLHR